ncbi:MAG TPA: tRNA pseudouridine(55) synthase TruB, partial [Candidatus Edwardsbacteria bacterium]|nr:tRNA pseudouridine(55) synthase TruB [Candidatus Edwardsbacteria bacterium]
VAGVPGRAAAGGVHGMSGGAMDAVLNINKPSGMTSFAAVSRVRRLARIARAGHAGTLDPLADGVLLVLAGQATRIARLLEALPKRYRAVIRLGLETDSFDVTGTVMAQRPVPALGGAALQGVLARFTGEILQLPPMFSALKKDGQPLYKLARQGIEVERQPRPVTVYALDLVGIAGDRLTLDVRCSKGTYIRALAHDIGAALGCGGAIERLTRTAVGDFVLDRALDLATATPEQLRGAAASVDAAVAFLPAVALDADQARAARHGNSFAVAIPPESAPRLRLLQDGRLLAIGTVAGNRIQPDIVFAQELSC